MEASGNGRLFFCAQVNGTGSSSVRQHRRLLLSQGGLMRPVINPTKQSPGRWSIAENGCVGDRGVM